MTSRHRVRNTGGRLVVQQMVGSLTTPGRAGGERDADDRQVSGTGLPHLPESQEIATTPT